MVLIEYQISNILLIYIYYKIVITRLETILKTGFIRLTESMIKIIKIIKF